MGPLPFIVGAGIVALLAAAASKSKAATASGTKPTSAGTATTSPGVVGTTPTSLEPAYLSSVPYVIALRVIALGDPQLQRAQGTWLIDNGYPNTGKAVIDFSEGTISEQQLRQIAMAEFGAKTPGAATTSTTTTTGTPKGTTEMDRYGAWLLTQDDLDTLYNYAMSSTSIPLVSEAASRLALNGDTRAVNLTQHLAELMGPR